jgi:glycosyltransferase involved in cell wall biosynthesis
MLVSICIPTHNRMAMLAEALRSALHQDCVGYEVVVSDNASTDGSADMVADIRDPRVRLLRQPTNIGSVANHNACVSAALGTWILFLHDDDVLLPGGLKLAMQFLSDHEDCDLVLPGYMRWLLDGNVFDNCLGLLNGISMSSTLFRRELLLQLPFKVDNLCCDWEVLFVSAFLRRSFCTYPFEYVQRGHHSGQEGTLAASDGRGVIGKSNAVRRLVERLSEIEWEALCRRITVSWKPEQLMMLARFVQNAGQRPRFRVLRSYSQNQRKWKWASRQGAVIAAERLFGPALTNRLLQPWRTWNHHRRSGGARASPRPGTK